MKRDFPFHYSVIQYHPGHRGECVNFGIIVKCLTTGRKLTRLTDDLSRLIAINPNFHEESHRLYFPAGIRESQEDPGELVLHNDGLAAAMSVMQFTDVRGGIGIPFKENTIENVLEYFYDQFVAPIPLKED